MLLVVIITTTVYHFLTLVGSFRLRTTLKKHLDIVDPLPHMISQCHQRMLETGQGCHVPRSSQTVVSGQ